MYVTQHICVCVCALHVNAIQIARKTVEAGRAAAATQTHVASEPAEPLHSRFFARFAEISCIYRRERKACNKI